MAKREVWFNKRKTITAKDMIAMYRSMGWSDKQIKEEMLKIKAEREAAQPAHLAQQVQP